MSLIDTGRAAASAAATVRASARAAEGSGSSGLRAALSGMGEEVVSPRRLRTLDPGDVVLGWGIRPSDVVAARMAEAHGARFINPVEAVLHSHRKANLAPVLERAGVPHVADGIPVRTSGELEAAVRELGGEARVTGGFSFSQLDAAPDGIGGAPAARILRSDDVAAFAERHVDNGRTFLVQPAPDGPVIHAATAGTTVAREFGSGPGLAPAEQEIAVRAARAFGLDAAGVDLVRGRDGTLRVLDVHATPQRLDATGLGELAASKPFAEGLDMSTPATTAIADGIEAAKPRIGVLNMGRVPGKNIARTLAEVERQGAHPVFLPAGGTNVAGAGSLSVHGSAAPIDAVLTRTGSVISDEALELLRRMEDAGIPVVNGSKSMSLVRDKNVQAATLRAAGVAHPTTMVVRDPRDTAEAIRLIGSSMVLKNPASSEGRGVMFLQGDDVIHGVVNLFDQRVASSRLVARSTADPSMAIPLTDRVAAERAILELGQATLDTHSGARMLRMQAPVELVDEATGAVVRVDQPVSVLSIGDAFRDARPGARLKAETWFREAAGVDTRVHVGRIDGEHRVLAAMERRAAPNEFGEARSNLSLGGGATAITPDEQQAATAIAAAKAFDLDVAGVDLIATRRGPVVLEVNASPGLDIEKATGAVADRWIGETLRRAEARP